MGEREKKNFRLAIDHAGGEEGGGGAYVRPRNGDLPGHAGRAVYLNFIQMKTSQLDL